MKFGLSEQHLEMITNALSHSGIKKAVIFGSRAKGNYKYNSDIDICIFGDLNLMQTEKVRGILDELPMPYKIDVVSYHELKNNALKEHIDRVGILICD